jgi:hypothetical protein
MSILAYLVNKNPSIGNHCRSLHLILDPNRRTRANYYTGFDRTTMHQDTAQANVIRSCPVLQSVHIRMIRTHWGSTPDGKLEDFHQTLMALSSCKTLRQLEISGDLTKDALFDLLSIAQLSVKELRVNDLDTFVTVTEQDLDFFPVLIGITRLSSSIPHLRPLPELVPCLERLLPNLELVDLIHWSYCPTANNCVLSIPRIRRFGSLVIKIHEKVARWTSALPNGTSQILLTNSTRLEILGDVVNAVEIVSNVHGSFSQRAHCVIYREKGADSDNSATKEAVFTLGELEAFAALPDIELFIENARLSLSLYQEEDCERTVEASPWSPDYCYRHRKEPSCLPLPAIIPFR